MEAAVAGQSPASPGKKPSAVIGRDNYFFMRETPNLNSSVFRPLRASPLGGLCLLRQPPLRRFGPRPLRQGCGAREESSSLSRRGRRRRRRRPLLEEIRTNRGRGGETRIPFVAVVFLTISKVDPSTTTCRDLATQSSVGQTCLPSITSAGADGRSHLFPDYPSRPLYPFLFSPTHSLLSWKLKRGKRRVFWWAAQAHAHIEERRRIICVGIRANRRSVGRWEKVGEGEGEERQKKQTSKPEIERENPETLGLFLPKALLAISKANL